MDTFNIKLPNKRRMVCEMIFFSLCVIFGVPIIFLTLQLFDHFTPIMKVEGLTAEPGLVAPGEYFSIRFLNITDVQSCDVRIDPVLRAYSTGTLDVGLPGWSQQTRSGMEEPRSLEREFRMPRSVVPGRYQFQAIIAAKCNWLEKYLDISRIQSFNGADILVEMAIKQQILKERDVEQDIFPPPP